MNITLCLIISLVISLIINTIAFILNRKHEKAEMEFMGAGIVMPFIDCLGIFILFWIFTFLIFCGINYLGGLI